MASVEVGAQSKVSLGGFRFAKQVCELLALRLATSSRHVADTRLLLSLGFLCGARFARGCAVQHLLLEWLQVRHAGVFREF